MLPRYSLSTAGTQQAIRHTTDLPVGIGAVADVQRCTAVLLTQTDIAGCRHLPDKAAQRHHLSQRLARISFGLSRSGLCLGNILIGRVQLPAGHRFRAGGAQRGIGHTGHLAVGIGTVADIQRGTAVLLAQADTAGGRSLADQAGHRGDLGQRLAGISLGRIRSGLRLGDITIGRVELASVHSVGAGRRQRAIGHAAHLARGQHRVAHADFRAGVAVGDAYDAACGILLDHAVNPLVHGMQLLAGDRIGAGGRNAGVRHVHDATAHRGAAYRHRIGFRGHRANTQGYGALCGGRRRIAQGNAVRKGTALTADGDGTGVAQASRTGTAPDGNTTCACTGVYPRSASKRHSVNTI